MAQLVITTLGLDLLAAQQQSGGTIVINTFKLGSSNSSSPSAAQTSLNSTVVYSGNITSSFVLPVPNNNEIEYVIHLGPTVGSFTFGEIGLFTSTGVLFAVGTFTGLITKTATSGSVIGNDYTLNNIISFSSSTAALTFVTIQSPTSTAPSSEWANQWINYSYSNPQGVAVAGNLASIYHPGRAVRAPNANSFKVSYISASQYISGQGVTDINTFDSIFTPGGQIDYGILSSNTLSAAPMLTTLLGSGYPDPSRATLQDGSYYANIPARLGYFPVDRSRFGANLTNNNGYLVIPVWSSNVIGSIVPYPVPQNVEVIIQWGVFTSVALATQSNTRFTINWTSYGPFPNTCIWATCQLLADTINPFDDVYAAPAASLTPGFLTDWNKNAGNFYFQGNAITGIVWLAIGY